MYRVLTCLTTEHDWRLVLLAVAVCFVPSVTAISLFHRAQVVGRARLTWLLTAGIAIGCGIWATHFTHTDITDVTEATKELQRTKTFLDTVLENVPATLVVKDAREQRYVMVNRAGEKLFAAPREEIVGRTASDFFPKELADEIASHDAQVVASGEQVYTENKSVELPGGKARIVTTKSLALPGEDGEAQYLMTVIEDVTERRKAEERIAHLAHHDSLTDLPNSAAFTAYLAATLTKAEKDRRSICCTVYRPRPLQGGQRRVRPRGRR